MMDQVGSICLFSIRMSHRSLHRDEPSVASSPRVVRAGPSTSVPSEFQTLMADTGESILSAPLPTNNLVFASPDPRCLSLAAPLRLPLCATRGITYMPPRACTLSHTSQARQILPLLTFSIFRQPITPPIRRVLPPPPAHPPQAAASVASSNPSFTWLTHSTSRSLYTPFRRLSSASPNPQ